MGWNLEGLTLQQFELYCTTAMFVNDNIVLTQQLKGWNSEAILANARPVLWLCPFTPRPQMTPMKLEVSSICKAVDGFLHFSFLCKS